MTRRERHMLVTTVIWWTAAAFLMLAAIMLFFGNTSAQAHSWYPGVCCSGQDCVPIPADSIKETPAGYVIVQTGELIPYDDPRVRVTPSEDLEQGYHWCRRLSDGGSPYTGKTWKKGDTICLFVPGRGT